VLFAAQYREALMQTHIKYRTLPELARQYGVSTRQAAHAVETYRVEETTRIAGARVYDERAAENVRRALARTGALGREAIAHA